MAKQTTLHIRSDRVVVRAQGNIYTHSRRLGFEPFCVLSSFLLYNFIRNIQMMNIQDEYPNKWTNASIEIASYVEEFLRWISLYILPIVLYTSQANVFLMFDTCLIS